MVADLCSPGVAVHEPIRKRVPSKDPCGREDDEHAEASHCERAYQGFPDSRRPDPTLGRGALPPGARRNHGTKRHLVVDTLGLLLAVMVTSASVQDRDGARGLLSRLHRAVPSVQHLFADGGYAGRLVGIATSAWRITVEIVKKPAGQRGFSVLPRRWVVERTLAWLMRWRRLVRDDERLDESHEAFVRWAMVGVMLNRLAPRPGPRPWGAKAA